eukprot:3738103-Amphidinium_carterae.1
MDLNKTAVSEAYASRKAVKPLFFSVLQHNPPCFVGFCEIMRPETLHFKGFGEIDVLRTAVSEACGPKNTLKPLENTCFLADWNCKRPLGPGPPPAPPPACWSGRRAAPSDPKTLRP